MRLGGKSFKLSPEQRIKRLKRGFPKKGYTSYGFDTEFLLETGQTTILSLQGIDVDYLHVLSLSDNPLDVFLSWAIDLPHNSIIWAHNLEVDMVALLAGENHVYRRYWYTGRNSHLGFPRWKVDLAVHWGTPCFGELYIGKNSTKRRYKKIIHLRDTFAFFKAGLDRIGLDLFGVGKKDIDERLYKLDYRSYNGPEKDLFLAYTRQDTQLVQRVGDWLVNFFKEQDITLPVSLPHASVSMFRRGLTQDLRPLDFRPTKLACQSYYGGRVQAFQKGLLTGVRKYDINSAYTSAIQNLQSIEGYKVSRDLVPFGIYSAAVFVHTPCLPYRLRGGAITFPIGKVVGQWVGIELIKAYDLGFIEIEKCIGYTPVLGDFLFTDFVEFWWSKKNGADRKSILYPFYKLIPNSLYGKTINLIQDEEGIYRPSSFFCPHWAAYITAYCRVKVMEAQNQLQDELVSIQTDGLWTTGKLNGLSSQLGEFNLETEGDIISIRGNAYLTYVDGQLDKRHTKIHGYMAPSETFRETITDREGEYTIRKWARRYHAYLKGGYANMEYPFTFHYDHNVFDRKTLFPKIDGKDLFSKSYRGKFVDLNALQLYI